MDIIFDNHDCLYYNSCGSGYFDIQQEGRSFLIPVLDAKTMSSLVSVMVLSFKLISDILSVFIINER